MRILVLGGTGFVGRQIAMRLIYQGDDVAVFHRHPDAPEPLNRFRHIHGEKSSLQGVSREIAQFRPQAVVDASSMTRADAESALEVLPNVPTVVLSSQDVYEAFLSSRNGTCLSPVPLSERSAVRTQRHLYRGLGLKGVDEDYEKLDVEASWSRRGATILRLPMTYGPFEAQAREDPILRRIAAGRLRIPVGEGTQLWSRGHVNDIAVTVTAAVKTPMSWGRTMNIGDATAWPVSKWYECILRSAKSEAHLVRVLDEAVPPDLSLSRAHSQHMLASVELAQSLLGQKAADPMVRIRQSVRWHLRYSRQGQWTTHDSILDDAALVHAL